MEQDRAIALTWLLEMETCVRTVDYERCRAIFSEDVIGFGTRTGAASGLTELERNQWRHVWGTIRQFTFSTGRLHCKRFGDALWLACEWTSERPGEGGAWVSRPGRITAILEHRDGKWIAVHTHHSLAPERP